MAKHTRKLKKMAEEQCEACKENKAQTTVEVYGDKPYILCMNCQSDIVNTCLSPKQFKNLLKNGHEPEEFLLHGDYYDEETGEALQPK